MSVHHAAHDASTAGLRRTLAVGRAFTSGDLVAYGSFATGPSPRQAQPCPLCPDSDQIQQRSEMSRCAQFRNSQPDKNAAIFGASFRDDTPLIPMMPATIRAYREIDAPALNGVALAAFAQFKDQYSDWPSMAASVSRMSDLASTGEIILAEINGRLVGGVVYVPGGKPKAAYFDQSWPIIRMLVVDPASSPDFSRHLIECCGKLTSAIPQPSAVIWA